MVVGTNGCGVLVSTSRKGGDVLSHVRKRNDLVHEAPACAINGSRFPIVFRGQFVHLDEPLAVEFSPDAGVGSVLGIVLAQEAHNVPDEAHRESVDLCKSGEDLGTVSGPELHVFAVVENPRQHLHEIVAPLLVSQVRARGSVVRTESAGMAVCFSGR
jgi:hypothetical protein